MEIIENVHIVPQVDGNTVLIVEPDGLTLIDAGLPRTHVRVLRFIESLGRSRRDLKHILITHADWDHVGGLPALHRATGARTYASAVEAQALAAGRSSRPIRLPASVSLQRKLLKRFFSPGPFAVDEILQDGQVLPILGGLRVIDTAGHCPGHVSFFAARHGILFCGDSMVTDNGRLLGSLPHFTWDAAMARQAVKKQAALGARIVSSGHGAPVTNPQGNFPIEEPV